MLRQGWRTETRGAWTAHLGLKPKAMTAHDMVRPVLSIPFCLLHGLTSSCWNHKARTKALPRTAFFGIGKALATQRQPPSRQGPSWLGPPWVSCCCRAVFAGEHWEWGSQMGCEGLGLDGEGTVHCAALHGLLSWALSPVQSWWLEHASDWFAQALGESGLEGSHVLYFCKGSKIPLEKCALSPPSQTHTHSTLLLQAHGAGLVSAKMVCPL